MQGRFTAAQVRQIFEIEAPRIFPGLRLDRYVTRPCEYKYIDTRRIFAVWMEAWTICSYNIPPNIESLTEGELKDEMFKRFALQDDKFECVFLVRPKVRG